jgi:hypothetical protein
VSQVRLYLDEDSMRRSLVFGLRARNVDVLTAAEADMINRQDEDHLAAASAAGRALFTYHTADYCALHQSFKVDLVPIAETGAFNPDHAPTRSDSRNLPALRSK